MELTEINFLDVEETREYDEIIGQVIRKCFEEENLLEKNLYVNVVLTTPQNIRNINKEHRGIDKETDVLSFPMFQKEEIINLRLEIEEVLGDIVISLEQIEKQAKEYAEKYGMDKDEFLKLFGGLEMVKYDLQMRKAMEILKGEEK